MPSTQKHARLIAAVTTCLGAVPVGLWAAPALKRPPPPEKTSVESTCDPYKASVLQAALFARAGRVLPVRFHVDENAGIHLEFRGAHLDAKTATLLANWRAPWWARALYLKLNGLKKLDVESAKALAAWRAEGTEFRLHLELNGLSSLQDEAAIALSDWDGAMPGEDQRISWDYYTPSSLIHLELNRLKRLSATAMRALVHRWQETSIRSKTHLELRGLRSIEDDGQQYLQGPVGDMHLDLGGIRSMDPVLASRVAKLQCRRLLLHGLRSVDPKTAVQFAEWTGEALDLSGLKQLDAKTADALVGFKGESIRLDGLTTLEAETAKAIASWKGRALSFQGVSKISVRTTEHLMSWNARQPAREEEIRRRILAEVPRGPRPSEEAETLSPAEEVRVAIQNLYDRTLELSGLKRTPEVEAVLARWNGPKKIVVPPAQLEELDPSERSAGCALAKTKRADARAFIRRILKGDPLDELTKDPVYLAYDSWAPLPPGGLIKGLSRREATILWALQQTDEALHMDHALIDTQVLSAIEARSIQTLVLSNHRPLSANAAAVLAKWSGSVLHINELTSLSPASARKLASWEGVRLRLNGVTKLSADSAGALSTWKGDKLELDGLRKLPVDVARALARWGGTKLELDGVRTLELAAASALTKWKGKKLELDGLSLISPRLAKTLASWPGKQLELDGLILLRKPALGALLGADFVVRWDRRPLSMSTTTGGVVVPDLIEPTNAKLLNLPHDTYVVPEREEICGVGHRFRLGQAKRLAALKKVFTLDLSALKTLSTRDAEALSKWSGRNLILSGLKTIDEPTMRALAKWGGTDLDLRGLTQLDTATAAALATWKGLSLNLSGLVSLDAAATEALLKWKGEALDTNPYLVLPSTAAALLGRKEGPLAISAYDNDYGGRPCLKAEL